MTAIASNYTTEISAASTTGTSQPTDTLDQNAFLNLLLTQMQNQDPLQPMDNTAYIAQLAQFSSLEQMQQVNQKLDGLTQTMQGSAITGLLGHTVTAQLPDAAEPLTGTVTAVTYNQGTPMIVVDGNTIDPSYISQVE